MQTDAIVIEHPERLALTRLDLDPPGDEDVVVDVEWSGISTGTERLLWTGRMPPFPGMGYPLVPGYESVGRVVSAGPASGRHEGERVFVPGATCYGSVRGLFGGAAARVVVPGARVLPVAESLEERAVLLALAATAHHALVPTEGAPLPDLIVGHGVLGRLVARLTVVLGDAAPVVWETNPARAAGALGYSVVDPADDDRRDYRVICDVSGDGGLLDTLIGRLARGGEVILAGFYEGSLAFDFVPAFLREARMRVAAQWAPKDLAAVSALVETGRLSLDGLITHREAVERADEAYRAAFGDPSCLKMILDWRARA
ncbi:chlorophyll synthesis pathway protein BchC [Roseospira navarrensis]|uniref:Chlorophyll synthesis pathway protein BchC n=1 Tax=Roseospira navarrensis TaxID=140058 RepID=A0A7X2D4H7_9PROT|nr:chlorophyll synthesis pathway protein BchC [Roseospira navarrensis]MQX37958.1 chlorophyll synthesis pathway protein BchC [Roseospira navarrensis]